MQSVLSEQEVIELLNSIGQEHITSTINQFSDQQREDFVKQVNHLNKTYPDGLRNYVESARKLLKDSALGVNPYEGFQPSIPVGETVDFYNPEQINHLEDIGANELKSCAFVLVAGGLGERLGYQGIKVQIPLELVTKQCFLEYYIKFILAFQKRGDTKIPLAIMTSDDTYDKTVNLLQQNNNFGMEESQLIIMKQEKVPAMIDNSAKFNLVQGQLLIETKPHGHGDVHTLLYQHKLTETWRHSEKKWVIFFQDTNPLAFRSLPAVLGVSKSKNLEVNSITIPRKPGESIGAICALKHSDGRSLTINVEYNQLDSLLSSTIGKEPVDQDGNSVFPGNINTLVFSLQEFDDVLQLTKGGISEFINPKYADSTKTLFKSSTRLECMMQDYPKLLKSGDRVGFTQVNRAFCFSTLKNDLVTAAQKQKQGLAPETAGSCENDYYTVNRNILNICGANIQENDQSQTFQGINVAFNPRIVLDPDFGVTLREIKSKLHGQLNISGQSTIVIPGGVQLGNINLDGTLFLLNSEEIQNFDLTDQKYFLFKEIDVKQTEEEYLKIRGYDIYQN